MTQELENELRKILALDLSGSNTDFPDSILTYNVVCNHDDGYLCEHRLEWLIEFLKEKI